MKNKDSLLKQSLLTDKTVPGLVGHFAKTEELPLSTFVEKGAMLNSA